MRYTKIFIVRWSDADVNGHMRNTSYSEYATDVRMSFFADRGWPHARFEETRLGPVLLREELDYLRELRLGDTVEVDLTCVGLSPDGSRMLLAHDFWRPGGKKVARVVSRAAGSTSRPAGWRCRRRALQAGLRGHAAGRGVRGAARPQGEGRLIDAAARGAPPDAPPRRRRPTARSSLGASSSP